MRCEKKGWRCASPYLRYVRNRWKNDMARSARSCLALRLLAPAEVFFTPFENIRKQAVKALFES